MDPTPSPAPKKKKEGWLGVGFTAALCGIFLFWWYQPTRVDTTTEQDPTYWVGLARQELGTAEPPLSLRLEIILIAEALRSHRQEIVADALETDWLPPAWLSSPTAPRQDHPPASLPAPLTAALEEAATALDSLEIELGQQVLRTAATTAATTAASLPAESRQAALWLVTARQARHGFPTEASQTRQQLNAQPTAADFPPWLLAELFDAEIIAPVVASYQDQPPTSPPVIDLAQRWRQLARDRSAVREQSLLTQDGPAADASMPAPAAARALHQAVTSNQWEEVSRLSARNPAAQLAVARLLTWLAPAPPPPP
jgi:hypothetical protein